MRKLIFAGAALLVASSAATGAIAADGCGPRRFRSHPFGHCHWDGPPPPPPGYYAPRPAYYGYAPPPPPPYVVDRWYAGRGYWDGGRWWGHRHHRHGGWRYY